MGKKKSSALGKQLGSFVATTVGIQTTGLTADMEAATATGLPRGTISIFPAIGTMGAAASGIDKDNLFFSKKKGKK